LTSESTFTIEKDGAAKTNQNMKWKMIIREYGVIVEEAE